MKKYFKESKKFILITGFKNLKICNAKDFIKKIREKTSQKVWIQFFDSSLIATWEHLFFATLNAQLSFKNNSNISKSMEIETLLYASTQNQIDKAIKIIGLKDETEYIAIVIVGKNESQIDETLLEISESIGKKPDDSVIELSKRKLKKIAKEFNISDNEIASVIKKDNINGAVRDIILEKIALLSTKS